MSDAISPSPPTAPASPGVCLHAWRHPRARDAEGRCIGRTDLPVDARRVRRLAQRIRAVARREDLPRIVLTSSLTRSRAVGQWLTRHGWQHRIDDALAELDFGRWDGKPWASLPEEEFRHWCADFITWRPGGGESVGELLQRVAGFDPGPARIVVTHGGWLSAAIWLQSRQDAPPESASWPPAPEHASHLRLPWPPGRTAAW